MYRFGKIDHNVMEHMPILVEKLSSDADIVNIYLFGSYARGKETAVSDIDLGVLLDIGFPHNRYFEKKLDLLTKITSLLRTDDVDLVIMNQAPPALNYRILSKGRLLYERDGGKGQRVNFQVRTWDRYFDFKPVEKVIHQGLLKRIREDRFGGR